MSRNGSGTYSLPIGNPVVTGTTISSTWANNTLTDIANALTGSLAADGQTTASGNLNMGTNKIVNAGDPTNAQDVATKYYVDQLIAALGTMAYQDADSVDITGGDVINVNLDLHEMTNEVYLPVGPTALRTASPINGLMRFNTDGGGFYEGYINGDWQKFVTVNEGSYTITYVVIGGGGGGGGAQGGGGGGGAGQYTSSTFTAVPETVFTMLIGGGGAYGSSGTSGSTTSITGIASCSGGIGGAVSPDQNFGGAGGASGNGFSGGAGAAASGGGGSGGGGGGSTAAGAAGTSGACGNGGAGTNSVITGVSAYYAGGGGGGGQSGSSGGSGVGGNGATPSVAGSAGAINTGSGGGGGTNVSGGNGGSGVVILSMPTANYTGTHTGSPTVITSGSDTILKFTGSGTYTA